MIKLIYISIFVLLVSLYPLFRILKRRKYSKILTQIDYTEHGKNIVESISNCKKLHKKLVLKIHPDKLNFEKKEQADKLLQKINESKNNYKFLQELELEVFEFLNKK
jgi:hypothetical protein